MRVLCDEFWFEDRFRPKGGGWTFQAACGGRGPAPAVEKTPNLGTDQKKRNPGWDGALMQQNA